MKIEEAIARVLNSVNDGLSRADVTVSIAERQVGLNGEETFPLRQIRVSAYRVDMGQTTRIDITNL